MILKIIKRDGREAPFNIEKIANAIFKAAQALGGKDYEKSMELACEVAERLEVECKERGGIIPNVEQIQDMVERVLIENGHAMTAKEFILYRAERTRIREMNTKLMKLYEDLTFQDSEECEVKRENANIDGDTAMGTMLKYGSEGAKQFYDLYMLDPKISKSFREGDIHIHDFEFYALTTTCCQIDIEKLFQDGFSTGHGHLREPQDIQSYSALACIAIQANQNDQHGGQSIPNFDYGMALGVKKTFVKNFKRNLEKALCCVCEEEDTAKLAEKYLEKTGLEPELGNGIKFKEALNSLLTASYGAELAAKIIKFTYKYSQIEIERSTYQAMEALVHNLNTMHSRAGAQIPFSSINYGLDTTPEGRLVIKSILLATEAGLGKGETPIFPIQIFKIKEGINYNKSDPNYDLFKLACRVSAKRLFPNFSFLDAPFNLQYYKPGNHDTEIAYMGCRTRVIGNYYDKTRQTVGGRGNLSFTSINLPRIAIQSQGDVDRFFEDLDRKIALVIDQLLARFKIQCQKKVRNFPFLMGEGIWLDSEKLKPDDIIGEVLKHGTLAIGFIGLAEALKSLIGVHHGENEDAQNLGLDIIGFMRKRADEATVKYGLNFTLLATPAEGLSGHFIKKDKKVFGELEGITDKDYYTNSFHVPVYYDMNAYDKIRIEAPYHALTNAGHITYVELDGNPLDNLEAFEQIVRYMKESGVGYGSLNHPVDRDPVCGYTGIIGNECPNCGRTEGDGNAPFERIRRITGYLVGTMKKWNNAKKSEEHDRVKHTIRSEIEQI
ncbi:MAG: anaerobic ribonucleoside triphosphate reductase [Oscillospiraceae bacterium]|nr:anaerobic ribonucleoside triphosphate reductase [Oscillospiraceae bacterium]